MGSAAPALHAQGTGPAASTEQILSYDSDITVNADSTLRVRETIKVYAPGVSIRHGLYRDFPTRYRDRFGDRYTIHLEVVSLERDSQPEEYYLRKISNGLRIYMGRNGERVAPGEHTYELTYAVDRALGFFNNHDELYWNVAGNGWMFPIAQTSATVHLPNGIVKEAIIPDAYTGAQGSAETGYTAAVDDQSNVSFRTTRALSPDEGLTIVVRWPNGFVHPPTDDQNYRYFLEDHQADLIGLAGLVLLLIYCAAVWLLAGRRGARGPLGSRPELPPGFSPAAVGYAWRRAFDQKTLVANLTDLAVKKHLAIREDTSGACVLSRVSSDPQPTAARGGPAVGRAPEITADEEVVLDKLLGAGESIRLESAHHALVSGALEALHYHLRFSMEKWHFRRNRRYLIPGLLIALATIVRCGIAIQGAQRLLLFFLTIWVLLGSLGCLTAALLAIAAWRYAFSGPRHAPAARQRALTWSAISLGLFICEGIGLWVVAWAASAGVAAVLVLLVAVNCLFHHLLKSPRRLGRALRDNIESLRMFMSATEEDPHGTGTPFKITPGLFEKFLPYALALNVEQVWGERFAFALALAHTMQGGKSGYSPGWYAGLAWDPFAPSTFPTSLAISLDTALASSVLTSRAGSADARPGREESRPPRGKAGRLS